MISGPSHDGPNFITRARFQRTQIAGDVAVDLLGRRHRSTRVANEKPQLKGAISYPLHFCKKIRTQQSNGRRRSCQTTSDVVPPSRTTRVDRLRNAGNDGGGGEYRRASSHRGRGRTTTTTGGKPSTREEALARSGMPRRQRRDVDARYARGRTARTGGGTGGGTTCDAAAASAGMRRWHRRGRRRTRTGETRAMRR